MGLIGISFLGTLAINLLARGFTPFPSCLGATQVSRALALLHTNYSIMYSRFETTLGWFGESLVTLTPGVVGKNPLTACATGE